jgi:hypothetical protein
MGRKQIWRLRLRTEKSSQLTASNAKVSRLPRATQKRPNSRQPFELPLQFTVRSLLHFVATRRKMMAATKTGGAKRGFAAMDPAKQREIASKGGKASHGGGRRSASSSR